MWLILASSGIFNNDSLHLNQVAIQLPTMVYMNPHFPGGCAETHFTNACLEVELELFQILVSHANAQLTRSVSRPEKKKIGVIWKMGTQK